MIWLGVEAAAAVAIMASVFLYGGRSRSARLWAGLFGVSGALLWTIIGARNGLQFMMGMNIILLLMYLRNCYREVFK